MLTTITTDGTEIDTVTPVPPCGDSQTRDARLAPIREIIRAADGETRARWGTTYEYWARESCHADHADDFAALAADCRKCDADALVDAMRRNGGNTTAWYPCKSDLVESWTDARFYRALADALDTGAVVMDETDETMDSAPLIRLK